MNFHESLAAPWVQRAGWTLLHSLWEMAAIAALAWLAMASLRRRSAQTRYLVACIALAVMLFLALGTFFVIQPSPVAPVVSADQPAQPQGGTFADSAPLEGGFHPRLPFSDARPRVGGGSNDGIEPPIPHPPSIDSPKSSAPPDRWPSRLAKLVEPILPYMVIAWLVGLTLVGLWRLGGWIAAMRLRSIGTRQAGPDITAIAQRIARQLRIAYAIRVMESALVHTPMVIGWLRPVVLLPVSILTGLPRCQMEAILAHELAHIRRHDYLLNLVQSAVETLLFYHPAVWWVSARVRAERERCCDDVALDLCGDRIVYAEALAALEESRMAMPAVAASSLGGRDLLDRVRRVLGTSDGKRSHSGLVAALMAFTVMAAFVAVPLTMIRAQPAPGPHASSSDASQSKSQDEFIDPALRFLGFQSDKGGAAPIWRPNGQEIAENDPDHLLTVRHPCVCIGTNEDADRQVLCLWFSHPRIDGQSAVQVRLFDASGKQLITAGPTIATESEPPPADGGAPGWLHYSTGLGSSPQRLPPTVQVELRYSVGPWTAGKAFKPDENAIVGMGNGAMVNTVGQSAAGKAFIVLTRDSSKPFDTQYDFTITTKDGKQLDNRGGITGGSGNLLTQQFNFDVPLAQVESFHLRQRSIRAVVFKDVSTQPGHLVAPTTSASPTTLPAAATQAAMQGDKDSAAKPAHGDVTAKLVGVWHISGQTILQHDMKAVGVATITDEQRKRLLPLADALGTRYRLYITSDGKWEMQSTLDGNIDSKEPEIFIALLGHPGIHAECFPNDPKKPAGGTWTFDANGLTHSGFGNGIPLHNSGPITLKEGMMRWTDAKTGQSIDFVFAGRYKHDPDPKYRYQGEGTFGFEPVATQAPKSAQAATQPAHTITCTMTGRQADIPDQIWKAMLKDGHARMESASGTVAVSDAAQGKILQLDTQHKTAMVYTLDASADTDPMFSVVNFLKMADPEDAPLTLVGKKQIGGREAEGVQFSIEGKTHIVWRDAATHRPVEIEIDLPSKNGSPPFRTIYSDIVFDAPLDDGLFSLQPPPGYEIAEPASQPATKAATQQGLASSRPAPRTVVYKRYLFEHPAEVQRVLIAPGCERTEDPDGTVSIINTHEGKGLHLDPKAKTAIVSTLIGESANDQHLNNAAQIQKLTEQGKYPGVPQANKQIAGREARGVKIYVGSEQRIIWRDAVTDRPVQVEMIIDPNPFTGQPLRWVYSEFVFDSALDDALFSTKPPAGYEVKEGAPLGFRTMQIPATQAALQASAQIMPYALRALGWRGSGPPATQPLHAAVLDFRIAAEIGPGEKPAGNMIPQAMADQLIASLKDHGPRGEYDRPAGFDWFEKPDADERAISGTYKDKHYVLLMTGEPYTLLAEENGRRTWGLKTVDVSVDARGGPSIVFEFDAVAAQRFGKLTKANLRRRLAVLIDGKVISMPTIMLEIGRSGVITGGANGFEEGQARRIVEELRRGMPATRPAATGPAAAGVQMRLNAGEPFIRLDGSPRFSLDFHNLGKDEVEFDLIPTALRLQVDGTWYRPSVMEKMNEGLPQYGHIIVEGGASTSGVSFTANSEWFWEDDKGQRMSTFPGKHVFCLEITPEAVAPVLQPPKLVSNGLTVIVPERFPRPATQAATAKLVVRLLDPSGKPLEKSGLCLRPASVGFSRAINAGPYWADLSGVVTIADLVPGRYRFSLFHSPLTVIDLTVPPEGLDAKVTVNPAPATQPRADVDVKITGFENDGHVVVVSISNNTAEPYRLTDTDLSLTTGHYTVFPPASQQHAGLIVPGKGQGQAVVKLNCDEYAARGLWIADSFVSWPGPSGVVGETQIYQRVCVANTYSVAAPMPEPQEAATTPRALAPTPAPAGDNSYATDFTKTLGDWKIEKAEGKQVDGEGVKFTDLKILGGLQQEGKNGLDISATPVVLIEVENNGGDEILLRLHVESDGTHNKTYEEIRPVAKGKSTIKVNLKKNPGIDLTKLTYVKIFGKGECSLTIKRTSFAAAF